MGDVNRGTTKSIPHPLLDSHPIPNPWLSVEAGGRLASERVLSHAAGEQNVRHAAFFFVCVGASGVGWLLGNTDKPWCPWSSLSSGADTYSLPPPWLLLMGHYKRSLVSKNSQHLALSFNHTWVRSQFKTSEGILPLTPPRPTYPPPKKHDTWKRQGLECTCVCVWGEALMAGILRTLLSLAGVWWW